MARSTAWARPVPRLCPPYGAGSSGFADDDEGDGIDGDHGYPHTSFDRSTIILSLAHCSSSASTLPSSVDAKPHCGLRASCSGAATFVASSIRRLTSSFFSSVPDFEVTRPSTTTLLPLGRNRSGSEPPARRVSDASA